MAEYIEREALLEDMATTVLPRDAQHLYLAMRGMVRNAPTADVVEVVMFKDCMHLKNDTEYCKTHNKYYCELENTIKSITHYCGYGERKECSA